MKAIAVDASLGTEIRRWGSELLWVSTRISVTLLPKAMLEELQRRNQSPITIRIYLHAIEEFPSTTKRRPTDLGWEHIKRISLPAETGRYYGLETGQRTINES
jgi:hypothetical protein